MDEDPCSCRYTSKKGNLPYHWATTVSVDTPQEEVIYILKGYGEVKVDDSVEKLKEGTVIYLPSNSDHYIENQSEETMKFAFAFSPQVSVGSYG